MWLAAITGCFELLCELTDEAGAAELTDEATEVCELELLATVCCEALLELTEAEEAELETGACELETVVADELETAGATFEVATELVAGCAWVADEAGVAELTDEATGVCFTVL